MRHLRQSLFRVSMWGLGLWLFGTTASADDTENLLVNAGFEKGGRSLAGWQSVFPPALAQPRPVFAPSEDSVHEGRRCGSIEVRYQGGYTSLTQEVAVDGKARSVHFEGQVRVDDPEAEGAASLMIWFNVPGDPQGGSAVQSKRLTTEEEWTRLTLDAAIPKGTRSMIVRCGVFGPCSASFDDLLLQVSDQTVTPSLLAVAHADYTARASAKARKGWVRVSIPFPLGGQTPLAVRVTSEPDGKVVGLRVAEDRENRPLQIRLAPLDAGDVVALRVETLTLLRDRELASAQGVALTGKGRPPKEVRLHLEPAPGIDADAKEVQGIAGEFSDRDLAHLMTDLSSYLREHMTYAGGASQGAVECLESGQAVCTGYANTAAALLIARDVPTRVLACTGLGSRLQEHYIVEAWTPDLGWSRMESTAAMFPWQDSKNLVLRIVYPDAFRSAGDVPLYKEGGGHLDCHFRMGDDSCWQGSEQLSTHALSGEAVTQLESLARERFAALIRKEAKGATVDFLHEGDGLDEEAEEIAHLVAEWCVQAR